MRRAYHPSRGALWMDVFCQCRMLSGRGLCDGLISRPEESYRLWYVFECDIETWRIKRPWPTGGLSRQRKIFNIYSLHFFLPVKLPVAVISKNTDRYNHTVRHPRCVFVNWIACDYTLTQHLMAIYVYITWRTTTTCFGPC